MTTLTWSRRLKWRKSSQLLSQMCRKVLILDRLSWMRKSSQLLSQMRREMMVLKRWEWKLVCCTIH